MLRILHPSKLNTDELGSQAALFATERHFGRDRKSDAEGERSGATETGAKKEKEGFISFPEFRVFLLLLCRYFFCCKVLKEKIIGPECVISRAALSKYRRHEVKIQGQMSS